jgi:FtsH-binding integral membrane protein
MAEPGVRIEHPNRKKAASKLTRLIVVILLLVSAALVAIVTLGGWDALQGAKALQVAYIVIYLVIAFFVLRWSRGVLPLAAALAIVLLIFAAVSAPAWFDRDKPGFAEPALDEGILGLVTALIVPVQILLIAFAMSGFRQAWNVEVEQAEDEPPRREAMPAVT